MKQGNKLVTEEQEVRRSEVLSERKHIRNESKVVFNITYHPVFSKLKNVLSEIHLLLAPGSEHGTVFEKVHIIELKV